MLTTMLISTKSNLIKGLIIALLVFGLFSFLQLRGGTQFTDPDGFYHAKASQLLAQGELTDHFPWTYYTTWKDGYADQHYVYHWLMIPFNTIERLPWSVIAFGVLFVAAFYFLLAHLQVRGKPVWVGLLLLGSVDFLYRINLVKANALSLALLCVIAMLVFGYHQRLQSRRGYWMLSGVGLVSAVFVWTYGGFVCVPLFIGAYCFSASLKVKKIIVVPLLASLIGIAISIAFHPHSGNFLALMYDQLFQTGLGAGSQVPAGNEWLAFNIDWFLKSNILVIMAWLLGVYLAVARYYREKEFSAVELWLHIASVGFLVLALWHRRFIEYWVPFAVIASAVTITPYLIKLSWDNFWSVLKTHWQLVAVVVALVGAVGIAIQFNTRQVVKSLAAGSSGYEYQGASDWMANHSQPGEIIFNTQWDQFPQLFYWNSHNYYIVGLDPTFMYLHNQELYWQWRKVVDDADQKWESGEQVYQIVKQEFHARFVFIEKNRNPNLYRDLLEFAPDFYLQYEDGQVAVFEAK